MSTSDFVVLRIKCPSCGKRTEKALSWLCSHDSLTCATPSCGQIIDLNVSDNRALIDKFSDVSADIDAETSEPR